MLINKVSVVNCLMLLRFLLFLGSTVVLMEKCGINSFFRWFV